ncbi:hypothetical protein A5747_13405 [Mycobacterium sp. IS-836]|uniref:hypothetical protein n=1 Tax=Mycobacterium sp. IS-836 TaxID=1834160 RepID=UPI00096CFF32|nr:hypothetical protein [Mycobacterium sp. IS-836]OMC55384.1 hypothetical protein A5747_13405 [Mycobacterium sp. IS-836]
MVNPYDASAGPLSPALPNLSSVRPGDTVVVRKVDGSANAVSISPAPGDAFLDGSAAPVTLSSRGQQVIFEVRKVARALYWSHDGAVEVGEGEEARIYHVDSFGADATGTVHSDAAVAAALDAMGSSPGILQFGIGKYTLSQTITLAGNQALKGQGIEQTTLDWVGTGDCIRLYDPDTIFPPSKTGLISGLKIMGFSAGANSTGIHAGDLYNMRIRDVWICDFAAAGCVGIRLENTKQLSERAQCAATIDNCDTAVVFEHSVTGDPSFSYSDWSFTIKAYANQNGVVIRNGIMTHSSLTIRGNCYNCHASGGFGTRNETLTASDTNTGVALTVGATDSDTARIETCQLFIGIENGGMAESATPGHVTLNLGAGAFIWASGIINFFRVTGFSDWTAGTQHGWFSFAGFRNIDATFGRMVSPQTLSYGGAMSGGAGFVDNGTVHLESGNAFITQLANGNNTLTFENTGLTGHAVYDLLLIQPGSGAPGTVTLPENAYAVPVPLSLTTLPNEVDVLRVYTFDHSSYFVVQLTK